MFGDGDQNQNSDGSALGGLPAGAPTADVIANAPSAPVVADPMVTPATASPTSTSPTGVAQPEVGINGVSMDSTFAAAEPQIGPAKSSVPDSAPPPVPAITDPLVAAPAEGDLASIKQQALQSLEPLVGQLDLAPEEKYKTIMMVVQASDKPKMLEEAYLAASQIPDEKVRAQALLDIVNEVNYFTQQQTQPPAGQ